MCSLVMSLFLRDYIKMKIDYVIKISAMFYWTNLQVDSIHTAPGF